MLSKTDHLTLVSRSVAVVMLTLLFTSPGWAVDVGDTVRIRSGGMERIGTIVGTFGDSYQVEFNDGHLPTSSIMDESQFITDEQIEKEKRSERVGRFYQSLGGALAYATVVGVIFVLWWRGRQKPTPPAV